MGDKFAAALDDDAQPVVTAAAVFGGGAMLPRRDVIKREPNGSMTYKRATMTAVGLVMPDDATDEELIEIGQMLRGMESSIQWLLGDWLNRAERVWGQVYDDVPEYSYGTLRTYASVARSVQLSIRIDKLSFAHHQLVAALEPEQQREWLRYAAENGLSVAQMRNAMRPEPIKRDDMVAQVRKWSGEIAGIEGKLAGMNAKQREQVRTRAEWLSEYYRQIAEKAK
jgi:hypothetical protein